MKKRPFKIKIPNKTTLKAMEEVKEHEVWLYENPKALASVKRGLKEKPKHKFRKGVKKP